MALAELYTTLRELYGLTAYTASQKVAIRRWYAEHLGKSLPRCNCHNKYHDAVIELSIYAKKRQNMQDPKYIMRRGVVIHFKDEVYSRANITDDIARAYLAAFPAAAKKFESIPEVEPEVETEVEPEAETEVEPEKKGKTTKKKK